MKTQFTIPKPTVFEETQASNEKEFSILKLKGWKPKNKKAKRKLLLRRKRKSWQLFEEKTFLFFRDALGFPFVEQGRHYGRSQVDVAAGIDDTLLIIDCKTKEEPGPKNLHTYITAHSGKRGTILKHIHERFGDKYKKIFFILALQDIDYSEDDITYARESNVFLWGEKYIEILEELYKIFGPDSRYYFLKELGIKQLPIHDDDPGRYYEIPALLLRHNGLKIYNFFLEARKLLKLAYVARIESGNKDFYQRLVIKSRLNEIGEFIEQNGTFKNSIILSFEDKPPKSKIIRSYKSADGNQIDVVHLKIRKSHLCLWIIDGQHRLYGFTRAQEQFRDNFLPVVAIEDIDTAEQARTFIDINQKQKPVDPSLLWELFDKLRHGEEEGAISRIVKKLAAGGVFYGKIYIPGVARRKRKSYGIFFSNFCKGILDRNIIDSKDKSSLFHLMGKTGYGNDQGMRKVSLEINGFFALLVTIAKAANRPKWTKGFIFSNNGLNVFLRVLSQYLSHSNGRLDRKDMRKVLYAPLKQYFIDKSDSMDDLRRKTSSEGTREEVAYEITRMINAYDKSGSFAREYILRKNKSLKETDVYKAYALLEKDLRSFTKRRLSKISPNWWKERIPSDVRERAEEALKKGESPDPFIVTKPRNLMDCLDFMDYPKIFARADNWRDTFQKVFRDDESLRVKFKEIKPIRIKIAHPADMSVEERQKFLEFCQKMSVLLKK